MKSRLTFYYQQIMIGVFIFNLAILAQTPYQSPGFADVATYISDSYVPPLLAPPKSLVKNLYTSICLVQIYQNDGTPFYQSGVLFDKINNLVVTSMHGFLYPGYTPVITPTSAKVYFGYMSGGLPSASDPGWYTVNTMDPTPNYSLTYGQKKDQFPLVVYDFIVLKLDKVPLTATAAHVTLPFDKTYFPYNIALNRITPQPVWPFFLAHPSNGPMYLSYDKQYYTSLSIDEKMYSPNGFGVGQYLGWNGSSGGGLFWSNASASDSRCGDLIGIVCGVSDDHWPYPPGQGPKPWPYIKAGPTMGFVFDKTYGAKNLISDDKRSYNLTCDDLNTVWQAYYGVPAANGSCLYKYEPQHDAQPNIWSAYGTGYGQITTQSFPLSNVLSCDAPKGNYAIFIEMMKSTCCTNVRNGNQCNDFTENNSFGSQNLSTSTGTIQVYYDNVDGPTVYPSKLLTPFGINNFDFFQQTNFVQRHNANEDYKYSDVIKFQVGDINYDPAVFTNKTIYIKLQTVLRYNVGSYDVTQGLSVHSIKAVFKDAPLTSPSIVTPPSSPDQTNYNECRHKTFQATLSNMDGWNSDDPTQIVYIDWGEKPYKSPGDGSYEQVSISKFTDNLGNKLGTVSVSHDYTNNTATNFTAYLYKISEPYASNTNYTEDDRQKHRTSFGSNYCKTYAQYPIDCPSPAADPSLLDINYPDGKIIGKAPFYVYLSPQNLGGMLNSWSVNWDDGYMQTSVPAVYPADHSNFVAWHTFTQIKNYNVVVTAIGKNGVTKTLPYVVSTSTALPAAPTGLTATGTSTTEITINWTDNSNDAARFYIEEYDANGVLQKNPPDYVDNNTKTYKAINLKVNQPYTFKVYAWNGIGYSAKISITQSPILTAVPLAPTNLTATISPNSTITLNWTNPPNNNEDWFKIIFPPFTPSNPWDWATKGSTSKITPFYYVNNYTYAIYIEAYNNAGNSAPSNTVTITASAPPAPSNLTATAKYNGILVSWTDNANNETGYTVSWATTSGTNASSVTVGPNQTSTIISGLTHDVSYNFKVQGFNPIGTSSLVGPVPVVAPGPAYPNQTYSFVGLTTDWPLGTIFVSYQIYWGDVTDNLVTTTSANYLGKTFSHRYSKPGIYYPYVVINYKTVAGASAQSKRMLSSGMVKPNFIPILNLLLGD